jgi:primosomal protein N' (replication factor Y)
MERKTFFADIVLPLPIPGLFTYRVPFELNEEVSVGKRVVVQFGKKKIYTGLIFSLHENVPLQHTPKYILSVLDEYPIVVPSQFRFWQWMSEYYLCKMGEVMNAAIPAAFKLASESSVVLHPEFDRNFSVLNEKEVLIARALENNQQLSLTEISSIVEQKKIIPLIQTLIEKKVVLTYEELHEKYKPKSVVCVKMSSDYVDEKSWNQAEKMIGKKASKQVALFFAYLQLSRFDSKPHTHITRKELIERAEASTAQLQQLVKKGIFETYEHSVSRLVETDATETVDSIVLSEEQDTALQQIKNGFSKDKVVLLHGITSSGKTELYIKLIQQTLDEGKQVLFLLPEIALTAQIINRLRKYFGKKVGVYHSKYNRDEKAEIWQRLINDQYLGNPSGYQIILGARSSVFLPFKNLGLIIADEEHDSSYKQVEPAPRYHARDAAVYLGGLHQAKIVLGSATPAIESYFNALNGKYALVNLNVRYGNISLPEIEIVNIKDQLKQKKMKSVFSETLYLQMHETLNQKKQIILFQNRRGFSTRVECEDCQWIPQCRSCDVSMVYHKQINLLKCHYCGFSMAIPDHCPACGSTRILSKGLGTEKIEEETSVLFPESSVTRMDLDSTRTKNAYFDIISDFEDRKTDVLIGTQMVTKGLDFDNVELVGIINADAMLNYPDFRSHERAFQLMAQVSGRSGRRDKRGKVIIQTYNSNHPVIQAVLENKYEALCQQQLEHRKQFHYPPYSRLVQITLKHKSPETLTDAANQLADRLRKLFAKKIFGPEYPVVSRIKNLYLKNILIKFDRNAALLKNKEALKIEITAFLKDNPAVILAVDVDPV